MTKSYVLRPDLEEDWRRIGGGFEEGSRRVRGGLEEAGNDEKLCFTFFDMARKLAGNDEK